jgi:hypothetical protein
MTQFKSLFSLGRTTPLVLVLLLSGLAHAETQSITFSEGHAVRDAVDRLEAVYDLPITYEDPPMSYEYEVAKTIKPLSITYEVPPPNATLEQRKILAAEALATVVRNNAALWGDEFKIIEGNGGFEVVPVRYRNSAGMIVGLHTVLDTPISIPAEDRTPQETVKAILQAVKASSGVDIIPGAIAAVPNRTNPTNERRPVSKLNFGAANEPARDVLARLFAQLPVTGAKVGPCLHRGEGGNGDQNCYWNVPANLVWQQWCGEMACLLHLHVITPPGSLYGQNWAYKQEHNMPQ